MDLEYFIRKTLILLDAGTWVQRQFIHQVEPSLPGKSACAFLKAHSSFIQSSSLFQSQKTRLLKNDVRDWDFTLLATALNVIAEDGKLDENEKHFLHFIKDHRDMLQYSELLEVRKRDFLGFTDCFEKGIAEFLKESDPDFIHDIRALISEISSANIEHLKKNYLVRNDIINIKLKEYLSSDDAEQKTEILQMIMEQLKYRNEYLTVDLKLLPKKDDEQDGIREWLFRTSQGRTSETFNNLVAQLSSFGVIQDKGSTDICFVINCRHTLLSNLVTFLDGQELSKLLEDISAEISSASGKNTQLILGAVHVDLTGSRHEQETYVDASTSCPERLDRNISGTLLKLQIVLNNISNEEHFIQKELYCVRRGTLFSFQQIKFARIIVICEPNSGANSLLNYVFGQDLLPSSLANITRIKYGEELKITKTTKDTDAAKFVNKALSSFATEGFEKKEETEVTWPYKSSILKDGIEWIVMPETVRDSDVRDMLGNANGLLYIANAGSADCLKEEKVKNLTTFVGGLPLFILNRWEHVQYNSDFDSGKQRAKDHVYNIICQRLKSFFPCLNETNVIRFIRNKVNDTEDQKEVVLLLLDFLINNDWPNIAEAQEDSRWLNTQVTLTKRRVEDMKTEVTHSLKHLTEDKVAIKQILQQQINEKIKICITKTENCAQKIERHLRSSNVRQEVKTWSLERNLCSLRYEYIYPGGDAREAFLIMIEKILQRDLSLEPLRLIYWKIKEIDLLFDRWLPHHFYHGGYIFGFYDSIKFEEKICTLCDKRFYQYHDISIRPYDFENLLTNLADFFSKYQFNVLRARVDEFFNDIVPVRLVELETVEEQMHIALKRFEEIPEKLAEIPNEYLTWKL